MCSVLQKREVRKGPSDWQMGKDFPHFTVCYFKSFRPPTPIQTASHPSLLHPDTKSDAVFALDQSRSNAMSVSGVSDVLDVH